MSDEIKIPLTNPAPDTNLQGFVTKDSGKREQFSSGMQRDTQEGKIQAALAFDGPITRALFSEGPKSDAGVAFLDWYDEVRAGRPALEEGARALRLIAAYEGGMGELLSRYAALMTRGAIKYQKRNWMQANGQA